MQQIVLLRGINVGARNRIAMPALRELLLGAGLEDVRTYLQSGNVVVSSDAPPEELADLCERQIAERFGLEIAVVTRTHNELANVVARDPLGEVADNPKRYQVSFLSAEPDARPCAGSPIWRLHRSSSWPSAASSTPGIPRASRGRVYRRRWPGPS